jgi:hypothetical protein
MSHPHEENFDFFGAALRKIDVTLRFSISTLERLKFQLFSG